MRTTLTCGLAALILAGCATSPHQTLGELNRKDPEYRTRDCQMARKEAAAFDENRNGRMISAVAGNLVVPFAGTAAGAAMSKLKDDKKRDLNQRLRAACTSDPLAHQQARR
jgi:hypothetical protein